MEHMHSRDQIARPAILDSSIRRIVYCLVALLFAGLTPVPDADALPRFGKKKKMKKAEAEAAALRQPFSASDTWEPYFKDEQGHPYRLLLPPERNRDQDWMTLQFTEYDGNRSRIAIWKVEDKIGSSTSVTTHQIGFWQMATQNSTAPLTEIEDMLTASVFNTNRFDVIERKQLETILAEQDFGDSERVTTESAAQIGRNLGADYILFAAINEWTPRKKSKGTVGYGSTVAEVAMSVRVVDTETGKVEYAETVRATSTNRSINVPFFNQSDASPVNYALAACINKAAYDLATGLKIKPWKGMVAFVSGDLVVLNGGSNRGVKEGQRYRAVRKGPELINPKDGTSLGFQEEVIGTLKVTSTDDVKANAVITEGCEGLKIGDFVRPLNDGPKGSAH